MGQRLTLAATDGVHFNISGRKIFNGLSVVVGVEVAKRFTDTKKWRMAWYRKFGSQKRDLWNYLHENCDFDGLFELDLEHMEFELGFQVTIDLIKEVLQGKIIFAADDRIFLPAFVEFQYGELSESVRCHASVIRNLKKQRVWEQYAKGLLTLKEGLLTLKDKDKNKDTDKIKDKDQDKDGNTVETKPITPLDVAVCKDEWRITLDHFKISRSINQRDEVELAKGIQRFGVEWVVTALKGARKQTKGKNFDPSHFVSLASYLHKDRIERLVNIGSGREESSEIDWAKVFNTEVAS